MTTTLDNPTRSGGLTGAARVLTRRGVELGVEAGQDRGRPLRGRP